MKDDLARFPLLAGLADADRRALDAHLERLDLEAGTALFRQGDPGDGLLLLEEGRVRLSREQDGLEGHCGPGAALGPLSIIVEGPREASAETESRCRILRLSREAFEALRRSSPRAACGLLEGIVRESADAARDALSDPVDRPAAND